MEILHPDRCRDRESEREQRVSEQEMDRRWGKQIKKTGARDRQTDRQGGQLIITGLLPVFSKPLFYLTLPVTEKKRSSGNREEERKSPCFGPRQTTGSSHPHHTNTNTLHIIYSYYFKAFDHLKGECALHARVCVRQRETWGWGFR